MGKKWMASIPSATSTSTYPPQERWVLHHRCTFRVACHRDHAMREGGLGLMNLQDDVVGRGKVDSLDLLELGTLGRTNHYNIRPESETSTHVFPCVSSDYTIAFMIGFRRQSVLLGQVTPTSRLRAKLPGETVAGSLTVSETPSLPRASSGLCSIMGARQPQYPAGYSR